MSDTTREHKEQVRQSADYLEQQYLDSGQHMSAEIIDVLAAARLWLEGPTVGSIENDEDRKIMARLVWQWMKQYDDAVWIEVLEALLNEGERAAFIPEDTP